MTLSDVGSGSVTGSGLTVSGGGSAAVATAELFAHAQRLSDLHEALLRCGSRLAVIDRGLSRRHLAAVDAPLSALAAERAMDDAAASLERAAPHAAMLAGSLLLSARLYGDAELVRERISEALAARIGELLGFTLPGLAILTIPSLLGAGAVAAITLGLLPAETRDQLLRAAPVLLREDSAGLTDPRVVELVRLSVMSADDVGGGLLHLPSELLQLLGDQGLGIVGVATSARVVVALARPARVLTETPVTVSAQGPARATTVPVSFADRAGRVPEGPSQIRIDRYSSPGTPDRFEVYIGGTRDFSLKASGEPLDMTSNVSGVGGISAGSYRAAQQAMALAGIDSSSPVQFTGYSQGGLVAARLASSGLYDTRGLFTLGAPAGQVSVSPAIPWVAVEHSDDLVPATGGAHSSTAPLVVGREVFADRPVDTSILFPAHQLSAYRDTAALLDSSAEPRAEGALAGFDSIAGADTTVQSQLFRGIRE